jgi:hypothetical protein
MTDEPFDPKTVTVEELAEYSRRVRRARWSAVVAGVVAILPAFWAAMNMLPDWADWAAIIVLVVIPAGAYRLTFELLKPPRADIRDKY